MNMKQRITQEEMERRLEEKRRAMGLNKMRSFGVQIRYGPYRNKDVFAFARLLVMLEKMRHQEQEQRIEELNDSMTPMERSLSPVFRDPALSPKHAKTPIEKITVLRNSSLDSILCPHFLS